MRRSAVNTCTHSSVLCLKKFFVIIYLFLVHCVYVGACGLSPEKAMARAQMRHLERRSSEVLGRKVRILQTSRKRVVELSFDSNDDLEVLLTAICGQEIFSEG